MRITARRAMWRSAGTHLIRGASHQQHLVIICSVASLWAGLCHAAAAAGTLIGIVHCARKGHWAARRSARSALGCWALRQLLQLHEQALHLAINVLQRQGSHRWTVLAGPPSSACVS